MNTLTKTGFVAGLKENKLLALKCNQCGRYTIPPKRVCSHCASDAMDVVEMSGKGVIRSFTVIRVPPEGLPGPYIVALVELEEGPWLMGNILGVAPEKATMESMIGVRVKAGHKVLPGDKFSAGEQVAIAFSPVAQ